MVVEGDASLDNDRLEPFTLYILAPGHSDDHKGCKSVPDHAAGR